jgi:hypothetical protein
MSKLYKVLIGVAVLAALAFAVRFAVRGKTGASTELGGTLEAHPIPEFVSQEASRWVNGQPASLAAARGEVVFIEGWAPA